MDHFTLLKEHEMWHRFYFRDDEASSHGKILQSPTERNTQRKEMRQEAQQWKKQLRVNHTHMRAHTLDTKEMPQ